MSNVTFEACNQVFEGNISSVIDCPFAGGVAGGFLGTLIALGIFIVILFLAALYVYHALAWSTIAKKLKHRRPWLAWIPFASIAMRLQLGKFHWALIFLALIPVLGWIALFVLLIISYWRIYEKRKYPGWLSLASIVPEFGTLIYLVVIGFVAWKDRKSRRI
jgi:hypothetical protein